MASRVSLVRASTTSLEVCWSTTPTAQAYLLEVQKIEQPPPPQPLPVAVKVRQFIRDLFIVSIFHVLIDRTIYDFKFFFVVKKQQINASPQPTAVASPITYSVASVAQPNQQGQIIITTAAPIPTLVSTSIVSIFCSSISNSKQFVFLT